MRRLVCIAMLLGFLVSGCTALKETYESIMGIEEEQTAQELAWSAMDYYKSGDYKRAIERFEKLKDFFPFSKYVILADLKIADAHYKLEEYEEAVFAYEEFEKLHPRNEAVPYVIYQIGRCYFDQMGTPDRDPTPARKALEAFRRLQKRFPGDPYSQRAAGHIVKCLKNLAASEFGIGLFYYKSKHYPAALHRFKNVIAKYPDVGYDRRALEYIHKIREKIGEPEAKRPPS